MLRRKRVPPLTGLVETDLLDAGQRPSANVNIALTSPKPPNASSRPVRPSHREADRKLSRHALIVAHEADRGSGGDRLYAPPIVAKPSSVADTFRRNPLRRRGGMNQLKAGGNQEVRPPVVLERPVGLPSRWVQ